MRTEPYESGADYDSPDGRTSIRHADGRAWWQRRIPRRWHRCHPATSGWLTFDFIERCACGGIRMNDGGWFDRNSR